MAPWWQSARSARSCRRSGKLDSFPVWLGLAWSALRRTRPYRRDFLSGGENQPAARGPQSMTAVTDHAQATSRCSLP
jgi:hypothetical protein